MCASWSRAAGEAALLPSIRSRSRLLRNTESHGEKFVNLNAPSLFLQWKVWEEKALQYFFVTRMNGRNELREGMVASMEQELALFLCPLLPVIHRDYAPEPSTSIYTENLVLGHLPAILFLCWRRSCSGKISLAMEKREQEVVSPGSFDYSSLSSPWTTLNYFLPLRVHPSNGFRIWY